MSDRSENLLGFSARNSMSSDSDISITTKSVSEFSFGMGGDEDSVSTIVEKLVSERLKLGIVKSVKGAEQYLHPSIFQELNEEKESESDDISSLEVCLEKFDSKMKRMQTDMVLDASEPDENPPNVLEPNFSEPEDEIGSEYRNPFDDVHMLLNRTRSFYTPTGFQDSRSELKRLEAERERMWLPTGRDRYIKFLYEEALAPIKHIRLKGKIYDSDYDWPDDAVLKSLESLMTHVKPNEMTPEEWESTVDKTDPAKKKFEPYWISAPPHSTDKTINTIRYLYKELKDVDFTKRDVKSRRKTGRKVRRISEESEESEEEVKVKRNPNTLTLIFFNSKQKLLKHTTNFLLLNRPPSSFKIR